MLDERFWSKVNKDAPNACWEWTSCRNNRGYGMFSCRGLGFFNKKLAHRLSYEFHNGPISDGKHILHACDNPSCVNPAHLSEGTRSDNMRDCANKFRSGNQIVSDDMRRGIIQDYIAGMPRRLIAEKYGVSRYTINDYTSGRSMSWLLDGDTISALQASKQTKPGAKLDAATVSKIKSCIRDGMQGIEIARMFNIHKATVSDIKTGKCWRDVD